MSTRTFLSYLLVTLSLMAFPMLGFAAFEPPESAKAWISSAQEWSNIGLFIIVILIVVVAGVMSLINKEDTSRNVKWALFVIVFLGVVQQGTLWFFGETGVDTTVYEEQTQQNNQ